MISKNRFLKLKGEGGSFKGGRGRVSFTKRVVWRMEGVGEKGGKVKQSTGKCLRRWHEGMLTVNCKDAKMQRLQ